MRLIHWVPLLAVWTAAGAGPAPDLWGGRLSEFRLANGLRVAVLERHTMPMVTFQLRVGAGAVDEPAAQTGVSRMIERSFRHGSATLGSRSPGQEKALLDKAEKLLRRMNPDASRKEQLDAESDSDEAKMELVKAEGFGIPSFFRNALDANGASEVRFALGADNTSYLVTIPSERAEIPFRIWGDWIKQPSWRFFYHERNGLRSALAEAERAAIFPVSRSFYGTLFSGHPYEKLGTPFGRVEAIRASDAEQFFRAHYRPGNIAIAVVGDVTPDQAKAWANAHFGSIAGEPAAKAAAVSPQAEANNAEAARVSVAAELPPQIWMGWRIGGTGQAVLMVTQELLAGGGASWLSRREAAVPGLRQYRLQAVPGDGSSTEALLLIALAAPNVGLENFEANIRTMFAGLGEESIEEPELARAKKRVRSKLLFSLEDPVRCADMLSRTMQQTGSANGLSELLAQIDSVSREAVKAALGETVLRQPDATIVAGPGQRSAAVEAR